MKCKICGKDDFHKMSCANNTEKVVLGVTKKITCKNHVWRKDFLNGGKKCQVCNEPKKEPTRNKDVEE